MDENSRPGARHRPGSSSDRRRVQHGSPTTKLSRPLELDCRDDTLIKLTAISLIRHGWGEITTVFTKVDLCRQDQTYPGILRGRMAVAIISARKLLGWPRQTIAKHERMKRELVKVYRRAYCGCGKRAL